MYLIGDKYVFQHFLIMYFRQPRSGSPGTKRNTRIMGLSNYHGKGLVCPAEKCCLTSTTHRTSNVNVSFGRILLDLEWGLCKTSGRIGSISSLSRIWVVGLAGGSLGIHQIHACTVSSDTTKGPFHFDLSMSWFYTILPELILSPPVGLLGRLIGETENLKISVISVFLLKLAWRLTCALIWTG